MAWKTAHDMQERVGTGHKLAGGARPPTPWQPRPRECRHGGSAGVGRHGLQL